MGAIVILQFKRQYQKGIIKARGCQNGSLWNLIKVYDANEQRDSLFMIRLIGFEFLMIL
jgi:hypothetical protein